MTVGGVDKISLGGSLGSGLDIGGSVKSLQIKNGSLGGTIDVAGALGTVSGVDPKKGYSLSSLQTKSGDFSGSLTTAGGVGKVSIANGDFSGSIDAQGNLSSLSVKGKGTAGGWLRAGSNIQATGIVSKVSASYYETDNGGTDFGIFADAFGRVQIAGQKLTGADLPFSDVQDVMLMCRKLRIWKVALRTTVPPEDEP